MSKRENPRKIARQSKSPGLFSLQFIKSAFRSIKFLFVFACVVALLTAISIPQSPTKLSLVLGIPIFAELGLLGLGNMTIDWIWNASVFRGLITAVFGFVIGGAMAMWGGNALVGGVVIIALSVGLVILKLRKFYITRETGIRKQDPILTLDMVVFLASLLALVAGEVPLFISVTLGTLSLLIYKGLFSTIIIMGLSAGIMHTILLNQLYTGIILVFGILAVILGFIVRHREAEKAKLATAKQE